MTEVLLLPCRFSAKLLAVALVSQEIDVDTAVTIAECVRDRKESARVSCEVKPSSETQEEARTY